MRRLTLLIAVTIGGLVLGACGSAGADGATSSTAAPVATSPPTTQALGAPPGMTLAQFTTSVRQQVVKGNHVAGVASFSCVLPNAWEPGKHFTCYAYKANNDAVGELQGTVLPTQKGDSWNANTEWRPGV